MNSVERLDLGSNSWRAVTPLPVEMGYMAATSIDNSIYIVGGRDVRGTTLNTVHRYDVRTNKWDSLPKLPTKRQSLAAVAVGKRRKFN